MKINKILCLAVVMSLTACQNDEMTEAPVLPENGLNTLVGSVGTQMLSRAQIVLGNTEEGETFIWNSGDSLSLYDMDISEPSAHIFKISEEYNESNASATASFTTETALTAGHYYAAVYPSGGYTFENGTIRDLELTYELDDYSDASWKKYFSKNMYMYATGIASSKGTTMQFKHLCYMIRLTYTNETGETQEVKSVEFMSGGLNHGGTYSVADEAWHGGYGMNQSITLANPLMAEAGKSYDFYLLFFPVSNDLKGTSINVGVNVGDNNYYTSDLSSEEVLAQNSGAVSYEAGKCYHFNVTHRADMSLAWSKNLTTTVKIDNVELSKALYGVLGADKVTFDADSCALMSKEDVLAVTELDFGWDGIYPISSLAGIENFINLQTIYCNNSGLAECDLSKNKALRNVVLCGNLLTTLDLSNLTELIYVGCAYSENLMNLILTGCTKLNHLECMDIPMAELNIPNPGNMDQLIYGGNPELVVDLNSYTNLTKLGMKNLGLTELVIPDFLKSQLVYLAVDEGNELTSLDLTGFSNLEMLGCGGNNLTTLNLSAVPKLWYLSCYGNQLSTLDISGLSNLTNLTCGNQQNEAVLTLTLTAAQKATWDSTWSVDNSWGNTNVALLEANEDLPTLTVSLTGAGTLGNYWKDANRSVVKRMKVIGNINGTDIQVIRDITFTSSAGTPTEDTGALVVLDLSEANIVAGGNPYDSCRPDGEVSTQDNIVTAGMFGYTNLESIMLPDNILEIGESAFETLLSLRNFTIPANVTKLGVKAFNTCQNLEAITIPESVKEIGSHAFYDCCSLVEITIPENVTSIGEYAFGHCTSLSKVYCEALTPPTLNANSFQLCSVLQTIYVPASSVDAYKSATGWSSLNIVAQE